MKYFTLFFLFFSASVYAQINFQKGHIIDDSNNKINCYIKNYDWSASPDKVYYKLTLESDVQKSSISDIREFHIFNTTHYYKRFELAMDKNAFSSQYGNERELKYENSVVLLKVLVEGKANLYEYFGRYIFFYNLDDNSVKQLEYKKYIDQNSIKKENNDYQKELYENLKCESFTTNKLLKVDYDMKNLVKLFSEYNECQGSEFKLFQANKTPTILNFNVSLGLNFSALESNYTLNNINSSNSFDNQTIFFPGFNFELLLPYNKSKWSIFIGGNYMSYKKSTEDVIVNTVDLGTISYEYSYLEIPIGIKYNMYLNSNSKLFLSAAYAPVLNLSSKNEKPFSRGNNVQGNIFFTNVEEGNSAFIVGLGCNYNNKYTIGLNYYLLKRINNSNGFSNNMNGSFSLIVSYTVF